MIKKIHYCWFGGNPLPPLAEKCIASWRKFCPDYEIIEWNETNFDINCCAYVKEAYEAKKWAFVSDYARFKILYEHGGLYFDTDVEVIKPLDEIVAKGNFMGREIEGKASVAPGLGFGVNPGLGLIKELLDSYNDRHFINSDGSYNQKTIVEYTSEILCKHGLQNTNDIQFIADVYIYPKEYFCPMDYYTGKLSITKNTYSIHHYTASWHDQREAYAMALQKKLARFLPKRLSSIIATAISILKFNGIKAMFKWIFKR